MLDDLEAISKVDTEDALAVAAEQHKQLLHENPNLAKTEFKPFDNILLTGMGGSAEPGLYCRGWLGSRLKLPFIITRDYTLPGFVNEHTLVIASSYSGNTEEAISAVHDAEAKKAQIVCLTSGGQLADIAKAKNYPLLSIPAGYQPRMTAWFFVRTLANLFEKLGVAKGLVDELLAAKPGLAEAAEQLTSKVETSQNQAKQIASQLHKHTPIIYASPLLASAAYKWKINFNENAKNMAFWNEFSEHNHNEFNGWLKPADKPFKVVELESSFDHPQISKRFDVTNRLLKEQMPEPILLQAQGKTEIEQILWAVQMGDFVSLYLAILNGVDPTPVPLVEQLKQELV